ncbi:MAG: response regulator [Candidatus Sericytochromatia bacterium]
MPKILIVEDSRFIRYLLRKNIEHLEMEVVGECSDQNQALELYQSCKPDVIMLDYSLPETSGLKLVEQLLAQDIYARVVLMIPLRMESQIQNLIAMGIKAVLVKPFYPENLQSTLIEVAVGL